MMRYVIASTALALAAPLFAATPLVVNADWDVDQIDVAGDPSARSPWEFTLTKPGVFRVLDCCIAGDVWSISGDIVGTSSFYVGGPLPPVLTPYGEWFDASFSKFQKVLSPGTYMFSITGDGAGGLPAGVWLSVVDVPEPATWMMLITGFGLVGFAMRRRSRALAQA
ncbi:MAG: PEPxxWA-CTERM sorting domain-containing protein [Sphingomonadaceae bacterium]